MPEIIINDEFYDEEAEKLQACFSPGVIRLREENGNHTRDDKMEFRVVHLASCSVFFCLGRKKAYVENSRLDLCSRQVFMQDDFKDRVQMNKIRDHFICKLNVLLVF
jgi:DNA-directed RNA polymerase I and III subunit RPAC1